MKSIGPHSTQNAHPATAEPLAEHEFIRRLAAGEPFGFEQLMRGYNRRLYRLARAVLRDETEAEDALQEAYISAYRLIGQFRGDSALSTWLSRLVLNECVGRLRRSARRNKVVPIVSADFRSVTAVSEP